MSSWASTVTLANHGQLSDPLIFDVKHNPVLLLSSKTVVDRSTIKSHSLSDATDPFDRLSITMEEVLPVSHLSACFPLLNLCTDLKLKKCMYKLSFYKLSCLKDVGKT